MQVQEVILRAMAKRITWWQAAEIIGISDRSMRRWRERYEQHGYDGLLDRRGGAPSGRRVALAQVEQVLGLYRERYFDLNVRHFHEKLLRYFLPTGQDFVVKNMMIVANAHSGVRVASVVMLLISSSGVFLPLEVALNQVWGVTKNRSYLRNQAVSIGLALIVCVLAVGSVALTTLQHGVLTLLFLGHTENLPYRLFTQGLLQASAALLSVALFFAIYWVLPNRKLPAGAVLPTAIVTGLLWELAKRLYVAALPWLDFRAVYGPFATSVGLMLWAFLTGLLLLAGAHYSATRHTLQLVHEADLEEDAKSGA